MNQEELSHLKKWFADYCASFYTSDKEDQQNILLKQEHSGKVCDNMREIARDLSFDERGAVLAEIVALFHDVGRFPQYHKYKTFRDSVSVNHAALGAKVLIENRVLENLPRHEQDIIIRAVTLHNVFSVPPGLDENTLLFLKLIRDADKLDIWRVFIEYYGLQEDEKPTAVGLGIVDSPAYSQEVLSCLSRGKMVQLFSLKTLNDFKLLQLSWIYDLNFKGSFKLINDRDYINRLAAALPDTEEIKQAIAEVREFVSRKTKE